MNGFPCVDSACFKNSLVLGISNFFMVTSEYDLLLVQLNDISM